MSRAIVPCTVLAALLCLSGLAAAQEGTDPPAPEATEAPRIEPPPEAPSEPAPPPAPVEAPAEVPAAEEPAVPPGERRPTRLYQDEEGVSVISNRTSDEPARRGTPDAAPPPRSEAEEPVPEPPPASTEVAPLPSSRLPSPASIPDPPSKTPLLLLAGLAGLVGLGIIAIFMRRR